MTAAACMHAYGVIATRRRPRGAAPCPRTGVGDEEGDVETEVGPEATSGELQCVREGSSMRSEELGKIRESVNFEEGGQPGGGIPF